MSSRKTFVSLLIWIRGSTPVVSTSLSLSIQLTTAVRFSAMATVSASVRARRDRWAILLTRALSMVMAAGLAQVWITKVRRIRSLTSMEAGKLGPSCCHGFGVAGRQLILDGLVTGALEAFGIFCFDKASCRHRLVEPEISPMPAGAKLPPVGHDVPVIGNRDRHHRHTRPDGRLKSPIAELPHQGLVVQCDPTFREKHDRATFL